jgi:hypothetical protein
MTSSTSPETATNRIQNTLNKVNLWFEKNGFSISAEKTKSIMITRRCPRGIQQFSMNFKVGPNTIEEVPVHKILGMHFDKKLSGQSHIKQAKQKALKKINIIKCLARKKWDADQDTLLNIHQAVELSVLRYGESIYGSAKQNVLKRLEPVNNKGIRAAIGAFCITKTSQPGSFHAKLKNRCHHGLRIIKTVFFFG